MRLFACIIACIALSGCATTGFSSHYAQEQKRKLRLAQILLEDNRVSAAKEILNSISGEPSVAGVTDEALFRLAIVNLVAGEQKIATGKAGRNLDRLIKIYPTSPWRAHAVTLKGLMDAYDITVDEKSELEKTVRGLKGSNLSLIKENKDLRQDMEKLKNLELDLEMKKKR